MRLVPVPPHGTYTVTYWQVDYLLQRYVRRIRANEIRMLVPDWVGEPALRQMQSQPDTWLGGLTLGLVIVCPNQLATQPETAPAYALLLATTTKGRRASTVGACTLYR